MNFMNFTYKDEKGDNKTTENKLYTDFFAKSQFNADVYQTIWKGKPSGNSFCFINPEVRYKNHNEQVRRRLIEVFKIEDEQTFGEKFNMAISGDGQEVKRISVLHSSSLAALLMFYSVSKDKPLECTLTDRKNYKFTNSYFEVKTQVSGSHYSNMDVVLTGQCEDDGKKVILFLECKFSEYLSTGMCNNISMDAYSEKYKELGLMKSDLTDNGAIKDLLFCVGKGKDGVECLQIKSRVKPHYCDGVKQMISHFIGVTDFATEGKNAFDVKQKEQDFYEELYKLHQDGAQILLGEVLFDFWKNDKNTQSKLGNYKSVYSKLAEILNKHTDKITILPEIHTYKDLLKDFNLDAKVADFYQFR